MGVSIYLMNFGSRLEPKKRLRWFPTMEEALTSRYGLPYSKYEFDADDLAVIQNDNFLGWLTELRQEYKQRIKEELQDD